MAHQPIDFEQIKAERDRFIAFSFAAADAVVEVDSDDTICFAAGATSVLAGATPESLSGRCFGDCIADEDRRLVEAAKRVARSRGRFGPLKIRITGIDNTVREAFLYGSQFPELGDHCYLALTAIRPGATDTQNGGSGRENELLDATDFSLVAAQATKQAVEMLPAYVMTLLETDGLMTLGNQLGPDVAKELMSNIAADLRAHSINGAGAAQFGTDRFGLIHEPDVDVATLGREIEARTKAADPSARGISVEAHTLPLVNDGMSEDECAKALVYTINRFSKEKNGFVIGDLEEGFQAMNDETVARLRTFKQLIATDAFDVAFQSIVDLKTRAVHHYEALVRFREPGAAPFESISFAEEMGVISDFDLAMCRKVISKIQYAAAAGDDLHVAVNISGRSLETNGFVGDLERVLAISKEIKGRLIFEVTESSKIGNLKTANAALSRLRDAGFPVCLDDFGAGATAYQYLRELDVDYVKIDGVYVREALTTPNGKAFLKSMATLCSELNIDTVGEMVETEAEAELLREVGVLYGQGYLFGKAEPRPG